MDNRNIKTPAFTSSAAKKEKKRLPSEQRARQNFPILSDMKVKRVYQTEPISELSWAYMRLIRERDKTKRVYDIDPYVEVYQLRDNVYAILAESLDGAGDCWMYLVIGPEKAMLIDTAFGLGDLKGLIEKLIGRKELVVVNTHGHIDHAYGNAQFETVYCHEYEVPRLATQNEHMWDFLFEEDTGQGIWAEFDRGDLIPFVPYEIIGCPDGTIFHLGGDYEVELIFMGGHTSGHAGYLDRNSRIFFAGDDILSMRVGIHGPEAGDPFGANASVTTLRDNLKRLNERKDEFDFICPGHFILDIESSAVSNMLEACNSIVADPLEVYDYTTVRREQTVYHKYVRGLGEIAYREDSV